MKNMTYTVAIDFALQLMNENVFEGVEEEKAVAMDRLKALKGQLEKRNSRENKPTKTQRENVALCEDIWAYVSENGAKRATEVALYFGITSQKATALLKKLVDGGRLEKYVEKRVTYFRVAEGM